MSYESNKELLTGGFQSPYDICAVRREIVRVSRSQDDVTRMTRNKSGLQSVSSVALYQQLGQFV